MSGTTPQDRVRAALQGDVADRPPFTLWRHWPEADQVPSEHVDAEVAHRDRLGLDVLKLTPSAAFMSQAWGAQTVYRGDSLGVRDYTLRPVSRPQDWARVVELDVASSPTLHDEITTVRLARDRVGPDVPVLPTVFTPLSVARYLAGDEVLLAHVRDARGALEQALEAITRTTRTLVAELVAAGADGVYFSMFPASRTMFDADTYRDLALPHDQRVMEAAGAGWFNVAHFHLTEPLVELAPSLPVHAVSWEHTRSAPGLREGGDLVGKPVLGGVDQFAVLHHGSPSEVRTAVEDAHRESRGRIVLSTSCSYPLDVPVDNLEAFREAVHGLAG